MDIGTKYVDLLWSKNKKSIAILTLQFTILTMTFIKLIKYFPW